MTPIQMLGTGFVPPPPYVDEALELIHDGASIPEAARRLEVEPTTLRYWVAWRCPACRVPYQPASDEPGTHFCSGCRRRWVVGVESGVVERELAVAA